MPSPEVLDFAALLDPIPGPSPCGSDLRADPSPVSLFQLIKEDRKLAVDAERKVDQKHPDVKKDEWRPPDWRPLVEKSKKVLREQSKDLQVVACLIEALVRLEGFAGLRDGYRLATDLIERYWEEGVHPREPQDDTESRFSHILQLNGIEGGGTLIVPIAKIPLTEDSQYGVLSLVHHQEATAVSKITDARQRQARIDANAMTAEKLQQAVSETPVSFYVDLFADHAGAVHEFKRFCTVLSEKSGYDPPMVAIRDALEAYHDVLKLLTKSKALPVAPVIVDKPVDEKVGPGTPPPKVEKQPMNGEVRSREEALEQLLKIAGFFRQNEPQSVIPYALEQVVHWGRLSLPQLLAELITEESSRSSVFKQVGIPGESS